MSLAGEVAVVLGTRPEIIKLQPVVAALAARRVAHFVLHTNQHYTPALDRVFFDELGIEPAAIELGIGSGSHGEQTGRMLADIEAALVARRPGAVVVQGDTNTVLAAALAAAKLGIPIGHVEAGLRSGDRRMPEELNRIVCDHLAAWLYPPTPAAVANLAAEGIQGAGVMLCGNTVVDAIRVFLPRAALRPVLGDLGVEPGQYLLLTLHRPENSDDGPRLGRILEGVARVATRHALPVVFPVHPRTAKMLERLGLESRVRAIPGARAIAPLGFLDFLRLESAAGLILSDSGGVQEEACVLGVPCVTLRDSTERPETIEVGANLLAGSDPAAIERAAATMLERGAGEKWPNPFGDGHAAERIVADLARRLAS